MFKSGEKKSFVDKHKSTAFLPDPGLSFPFRLNFYDKPPLEDVTIEEFETCAIDRLRVLAEIESSEARSRPWSEAKEVMRGHCDKYLRLDSTTAKGQDVNAQRRKDHLGHFVLRLAFCRTPDLRRRFIKAETTLFRFRYETDDSTERTGFLQSRDFDWIEVKNDEKEKYKKELLAALASTTSVKGEKADDTYYKVRWTRVPNLVERRKVFLKGGWAYVPSRDQSAIIFKEFETKLEHALEMTAKSLPRLDEDSRLVPILENLSQGFMAGVSSEWSEANTDASGEGVTAEMVDDLARRHFPLCMRHLHESLREDAHLNHFGRLQYGLFLKVLGISVEEAIIFWKKAFKRITEDKFNKEYKYNIRHSFGLEGKRANYPAKSCQQILTGESKGAGCPYRHFSPDNLETALVNRYGSHGLSRSELPEIMNLVKNNQYHVACTRVFEITHSKLGVKRGEGIGEGESVTHPNQYAARSRELTKAEKEKAESNASMIVD